MKNSEYASFVNSLDFTAKKSFEIGINHHALSLASEAGEVAGKVVKQYYREHQKGYEEFRNKIIDEASDVLYHLVAICNTCGITIDELATYNFAKLSDRVKRNVLVGEGDNR